MYGAVVMPGNCTHITKGGGMNSGMNNCMNRGMNTWQHYRVKEYDELQKKNPSPYWFYSKRFVDSLVKRWERYADSD